MVVLAALFCQTAPADPSPVPTADQFYLHDGDSVVFYGDSITEQRRFTEYIASFCLTRFPQANIQFINSGWGYETVNGGPGGDVDSRLDRDVIAYRPTVVVICLGANDAGSKPFDRIRYDRFIAGYRHILDTLTTALPGVRFTLISPPAYDDYTRPREFSGGVNGVLQKYGEGIGELAAEYGATYTDCNHPLAWFLRAAERNAPEFAPSLLPDRVHPRAAGHLVIATSVLKAWHAPSAALDDTVDASAGVAAGTNTLTAFHADDRRTSFTLSACLLPWPFDRTPDTAFLLKSTYIERDLNENRLAVTGLAAGKYQLAIDGNAVGRYNADELARGIELDQPRTPLAARSGKILAILRYADHLHFDIWRNIDIPSATDDSSDPGMSDRRARLFVLLAATQAKARELAKPATHRFELRRI